MPDPIRPPSLILPGQPRDSRVLALRDRFIAEAAALGADDAILVAALAETLGLTAADLDRKDGTCRFGRRLQAFADYTEGVYARRRHAAETKPS